MLQLKTSTFQSNICCRVILCFSVWNILRNVGMKQQITIAMRKVTGILNASSFRSVKFRETVKDFVAGDQTFSFMNTIKGNPAYWERF